MGKTGCKIASDKSVQKGTVQKDYMKKMSKKDSPKRTINVLAEPNKSAKVATAKNNSGNPATPIQSTY